MKKILVPVDFSDLSWNALAVAVKIAEKFSAQIVLMHVVLAYGRASMDIAGNVVESDDFDSSATKLMLSKSLKKLNNWQERAGKTIAEVVVKPGNSELQILNEIEQGNYDLVVMGTHGATGLKELFIGSHTEHIAMKSAVPVLSLKSPEKEITKIAFASSFNDVHSLPSGIHALSKSFNAEICFLYVSTDENKELENSVLKNMANTASLEGFENVRFQIIPHLDVELGLEEYCDSNNINLLILESTGKKGISRWLTGSVSIDLINHSHHALLTYKSV